MKGDGDGLFGLRDSWAEYLLYLFGYLFLKRERETLECMFCPAPFYGYRFWRERFFIRPDLLVKGLMNSYADYLPF